MFYSINQITLFLLTSMTSVVLLIMNDDIFVYAQKEEGVMQDFTRNGEYYLYSIPSDSTSAVQPLQYFSTAITITTPTLPSSSPSPEIYYTSPSQTYYQQSPSPSPLPSSSPIQNIQLTQQQVTVEICSNGIDDDRDGIVDEVVGCTRTQTTIPQQQQPFLQQQQQQQQIFPIPPQQSPTQQPSPISQCEIYTLSVEGTADLLKARENIDDSSTDLTFEIDSILNPYNVGNIIQDDIVSGKLYIDKDSNNEKELNFNVKEITNDCKLIAYLDDGIRIQDDDD